MTIEIEPIYAAVVFAVGGGILAAVKWLSTETTKQGLKAVKRKVYHAIKDEVCLGAEALEVVNLLRDDIKKILSQFSPNGGSTIKDAVVRLENAVASIRGEVRHLRASAEMASDAAGAFLWRAEPDGRVMWVSKAIKEQLGYVNDTSYLGWAWLNMVHPSDRERVRERWEESVRDRCEAQDEYRVVSTDGLVLHVQSFARPVFVDDKLDGWQGRHNIVKIEPLEKVEQ